MGLCDLRIYKRKSFIHKTCFLRIRQNWWFVLCRTHEFQGDPCPSTAEAIGRGIRLAHHGKGARKAARGALLEAREIAQELKLHP